MLNLIEAHIFLIFASSDFLFQITDLKKLAQKEEALTIDDIWLMLVLVADESIDFSRETIEETMAGLKSRGLVSEKNGEYNIASGSETNFIFNCLKDGSLLPDPRQARICG